MSVGGSIGSGAAAWQIEDAPGASALDDGWREVVQPWLDLRGQISDLPDWAQCALWAVLLCLAAALLAWAWRRWRVHQRGLVTWTAAGVALLAAGAGVSVATGHVAIYGQTGFPLSPYEEAELWNPNVLDPSRSEYLTAMAAQQPAAVESALDAAQAHLSQLRPAAYPAGLQGGSPDLVLCFEMKEKPGPPGGLCRARCVVLRINGQPVRGGAGQLVQVDLSQNGPVMAAGWDDTAMTVNNVSNAKVRLPSGVARSGDALDVEWALVVVGPDDVTYRIGRHQHDVVVGPPVEIPKVSKAARQ